MARTFSMFQCMDEAILFGLGGTRLSLMSPLTPPGFWGRVGKNGMVKNLRELKESLLFLESECKVDLLPATDLKPSMGVLVKEWGDIWVFYNDDVFYLILYIDMNNLQVLL